MQLAQIVGTANDRTGWSARLGKPRVNGAVAEPRPGGIAGPDKLEIGEPNRMTVMTHTFTVALDGQRSRRGGLPILRQ